MASEKAKKTILKFDTEDDVAVALAKYTADLSQRFIQEKGSFNVVLSGGTLIDTMRYLTQAPHKESVDWSKWSIFWLDERVVPLDHKDSNYKLAYDGFLSKVSIPGGQIFPINDKKSPEGAAEDYEALHRDLVERKILPLSDATGFPKFDLMLLGMGPDGHVASLFPNHPQRNEEERWVTFITNSPKPPPPRITYTFPVINSSSEIAMVVTGAELATAVKDVLGNPNSNLPAAEVSPQGLLTWFLDKDAASKL
ncbi:probable 6-phosphogluconolactonase 4, chloroplastic [Coffea arabica]|uniref:Probable 6-phosphogluconolactonase n=1 Tax=Coffea arabica TaxID=13443 RepID=A0A6P6W3P7_COFAR|nr:probable 6-phosphogluconolactonase 4, chloroplastic [Coffea arabica]